MTAGKTQLRAVLQKGTVSGFAAAKIALYESWETEHARDCVLTEPERYRVVNGLKDAANIREYNGWVGAIPAIVMISKDAEICGQEAIISLLSMGNCLRDYLLAALAGKNVKQNPLANYPLLSPPSDETWEHRGTSLRHYIRDSIIAATGDLEHFAFCKSILALLADKTGVTLLEDVEKLEPHIAVTTARTAAVYTAARRLSRAVKAALHGMPEQLQLECFIPSPAMEQAFRKRLEKPLERDQWYFDCKELWLRERFKQMPRRDIERLWLANPRLGSEAKSTIRSLMGGSG